MEKLSKSLFLGILLMCMASIVEAQVIVIDRYSFTIGDIDEKTEDKLLFSVRKAIKQYDKFADLLDDETMGVSQDAINRFKRLFEKNATVYNDVSRRAYTVDYSDYASQINDYLGKNGVEYDIFSASVGDISYDSTGYYFIDVLTRKYMFNGLDDEKEPFYCKSGRTFNMTLTYAIPEDNLDNAKIIKIHGNLVKECQDKVLAFQPIVGYRISGVNQGGTDFFQSSLSGLRPEYGLINSFQGGVVVQKSLNKRNTLLATIGLLYQNTQIKSRWNGFYNYNEVDDEGIMFNKITQISNGKETGTIHAVNVPLGVKFRIADWSPIYLFAHPSFTASFPVSGKFNFSGDIVSTGLYDSGDVVLFNVENNEVVPDNLQYEADLRNKKLMYSGGIELSMQYTLNRNSALEIGLEFQYGLNSITSGSTNTDFFPEELNENNISFTEVYSKKIKQAGFGLKIGWVFKG